MSASEKVKTGLSWRACPGKGSGGFKRTRVEYGRPLIVIWSGMRSRSGRGHFLREDRPLKKGGKDPSLNVLYNPNSVVAPIRRHKASYIESLNVRR